MKSKEETNEKMIDEPKTSPMSLSVASDIDLLLPRVAPNASRYGYFSYEEVPGYHAHQSIAFYPNILISNQRLLFGVKNSLAETDDAFIYITDMNLRLERRVTISNACHINDMMFLADGRLMIAPLDPQKYKPIVRIYTYPRFQYQMEMDLSKHFDKKNQTVWIDSLCHSREDKMYIFKCGSEVVFLDYNFNKIGNSIEIDTSDLHGDPTWTQTMEYYKGYILQMNTWDESVDYHFIRDAYLNVFRPTSEKSENFENCVKSEKVDTFRYPDCGYNMEAEGICSIGNGKYLFTYYTWTNIEVWKLDFNTPSHTHTLSDIIDLEKLGITPKTFYVNPALAGGSYLAPDGSQEKPFPTLDEAIATMKANRSGGTIYLMDGNYGTVNLNNIYADLQFKGMNKETCFIDKITVSKCRDLLFENITFTDDTAPFEANSASVEINGCSFPNGKISDSGSNENYGINIDRNSNVILKACEINNFDSAVKVCGSKLTLEETSSLLENGNRCGITGENSIITGSKELSANAHSMQEFSLHGCRVETEPTSV